MLAKVRRIAVFTAVLWLAFSAYSTQYAPAFDCYERAVWNGHQFIGTGEWKCLK